MTKEIISVLATTDFISPKIIFFRGAKVLLDKLVFDAIQQLIKQEREAHPIGFQIGSKDKKK